MFRKAIFILLVLLLALTVMACGSSNSGTAGNSTADSGTVTAVSSTKITTAATTKTSVGTPAAKTTANTGMSFDDEDTGENESVELNSTASLPGDYPGDIFPVYPGSHLAEVISSPNGCSVVAVTGATHTDVIAFYKDVLKNATVMAETEESTSLTSFGSKEGYTYNLDVGESDEYTGYKTLIWISFYK